ncbi:hypothetical protein LGN17_19595 [Burkholderia sp. AU30280]|nr:hypothetical protein [Burkholderia sp. AU30280]
MTAHGTRLAASVAHVSIHCTTEQLRRLPVVDHHEGPIGLLSLAGIATRMAGPEQDAIANTLEGVSQPKQT